MKKIIIVLVCVIVLLLIVTIPAVQVNSSKIIEKFGIKSYAMLLKNQPANSSERFAGENGMLKKYLDSYTWKRVYMVAGLAEQGEYAGKNILIIFENKKYLGHITVIELKNNDFTDYEEAINNYPEVDYAVLKNHEFYFVI